MIGIACLALLFNLFSSLIFHSEKRTGNAGWNQICSTTFSFQKTDSSDPGVPDSGTSLQHCTCCLTDHDLPVLTPVISGLLFQLSGFQYVRLYTDSLPTVFVRWLTSTPRAPPQTVL